MLIGGIAMEKPTTHCINPARSSSHSILCRSQNGASSFFPELGTASVLLSRVKSFSPSRTVTGGPHERIRTSRNHSKAATKFSWRWDADDISAAEEQASFAEGVELFNCGRYYECHDVLENLWNIAAEPQRSILHGILQCSVGLYHMLNQNHRGAMVELGEGLSKLRRQRFTSGPFHDFEQEASAVLEYLYRTQLEYAACTEDMCITMDGSERSYQLLGNFGAGQQLYKVQMGENNELYIHFLSPRLSSLERKDYDIESVKVKLPILQATEEELYGLT